MILSRIGCHMTEWLVLSFVVEAAEGFKTVKVIAPSYNEAIKAAGPDFTIACEIKAKSARSVPLHTQIVDEFSSKRFSDLLKTITDLRSLKNKLQNF